MYQTSKLPAQNINNKCNYLFCSLETCDKVRKKFEPSELRQKMLSRTPKGNCPQECCRINMSAITGILLFGLEFAWLLQADEEAINYKTSNPVLNTSITIAFVAQNLAGIPLSYNLLGRITRENSTPPWLFEKAALKLSCALSFLSAGASIVNLTAIRMTHSNEANLTPAAVILGFSLFYLSIPLLETIAKQTIKFCASGLFSRSSSTQNCNENGVLLGGMHGQYGAVNEAMMPSRF